MRIWNEVEQGDLTRKSSSVTHIHGNYSGGSGSFHKGAR